ncbi:MAG: enoyl-[acyl-carrier protein] reductase, partial [Betaproteobacteria bacterium]|nr:enoyl-[acyl-carrier protein] reductase [Betaproteobacteria bacterium]
NEKTRSYVEPLARELNASLLMPLDVTDDAQVDAVFERVRTEWGRLDILVHSLGWAPKQDLRGSLLECSAKGFLEAMNVSCHSLIRLARLAVPLSVSQVACGTSRRAGCFAPVFRIRAASLTRLSC